MPEILIKPSSVPRPEDDKGRTRRPGTEAQLRFGALKIGHLCVTARSTQPQERILLPSHLLSVCLGPLLLARLVPEGHLSNTPVPHRHFTTQKKPVSPLGARDPPGFSDWKFITTIHGIYKVRVPRAHLPTLLQFLRCSGAAQRKQDVRVCRR